MTIIDFIELSDDDIIDLSSDEETVQEVQIATQHRATSLDRQGMFFLAGEGNQGVQAVFVAAGEGSQDVQAVFVAASKGSQDVQTVFVAASEGRQEATEPGHALEATALSMVMEKAPLVAASEGRQEAAESGHALEATTVSLLTETPPLGPTSTTPKAQTSEGGDAKAVRVKRKYRKGNYHTDTPRRSPRLIQMGECCTSPVEEPTADHKRSRMLGPAEESATFINSAETVVLALPHAGSTNCLRSPTSATFPSLISTSPTAVTSGGGDAKLVRVKAKHPERNYHILSLVRQKPPLAPTSTSPKALSSEGGDAKLVTGKVKRRRKNCRPCKLTP
ncbi:hypothetical protein CFC21_045296 [Triticum aestivum]|uniref:Uncharacterized protein n=4 Tax=Triticinae TaxID=1648030 RepID=A0A453DQ88_AEGTS|nr:uncharacterized protein LOC109738392 isoform X2 [Aegilops tauschii subsp. strangulata]XP_044352641.1 uncharacterized protein LOC123073640 isoform X2 [Triticum aestivum]KAF7034258.1 hypothetical protein CFC21_045296 [Triticum aestivum]